MSYEDSPGDMSHAERVEIHGIQLAQATDRLEDGVTFFDIWLQETVRDAEALLQYVGSTAARLAAD